HQAIMLPSSSNIAGSLLKLKECSSLEEAYLRRLRRFIFDKPNSPPNDRRGARSSPASREFPPPRAKATHRANVSGEPLSHFAQYQHMTYPSSVAAIARRGALRHQPETLPFQTLDAAAISAVVSRARSGSGTPRGRRSGVRNAMSSARSLVASRMAMMSSTVTTPPAHHARLCAPRPTPLILR